MRFVGFIILVLFASVASATVYKIVNEDGSITYSDKPQTGAEEIDVGTVQTYEAQPVPDSQAESSEPEFPGYEAFEVVKPAHNETLRDNGGLVSISLSLAPGLFRDHIVSIRMDGKELGSGRSTSITLKNVDRGSHTVQGVIVDQDGKTVTQTDPITFHLHRTSIQ